MSPHVGTESVTRYTDGGTWVTVEKVDCPITVDGSGTRIIREDICPACQLDGIAIA
jgi:hypothetical protein